MSKRSWKITWSWCAAKSRMGESNDFIDALKRHPLLMREFGAGSRRVVEKAMLGAGLKKKDLHISMELDSTEVC